MGGSAVRLPVPVASQQPRAELAAPVTTPGTTPSTDVAPAATHQAIAPSEAAAATPTVEIDMQAKPKSGMDKAWYPHPTNPDIGWLQVHNPTKSGVMRAELKTIEALAKLNVPVARVISGEAPPKSISVLGRPVDVDGDGGGAWLQKIDTQAQSKLKRLGGAFGGERLASLVESLHTKEIDTQTLRGNLEALKKQIDAVLDRVGEVDIAFSKDGSITLLDVAPSEDGKVIGKDSDGGKVIKEGLDKLMEALGATSTTPHV
jgi:predicted RNA-binding protein YlqC (UPF0109 family)